MAKRTPYEQIADASERMAKTLEKMEENLKLLNDSNILHNATSIEEHKAIVKGQEVIMSGQSTLGEKLQELTIRYWYLVLVAFILLGLAAGITQATKLLPGGI